MSSTCLKRFIGEFYRFHLLKSRSIQYELWCF